MNWQIWGLFWALFSTGQSLYVMPSQGIVLGEQGHTPLLLHTLKGTGLPAHRFVNMAKQGSSCFIVLEIRCHVMLCVTTYCIHPDLSILILRYGKNQPLRHHETLFWKGVRSIKDIEIAVYERRCVTAQPSCASSESYWPAACFGLTCLRSLQHRHKASNWNHEKEWCKWAEEEVRQALYQ